MGDTESKRRWLPLIVGSIVVLVVAAIVGFGVLLSDPKTRPHHRRMYNVNLISELTKVVEMYRLDYGSYPWPKPTEVTATTEIRNADVYRAITGGAHDYLGEVPPKHLKNGVLVDTWGHPIIFRVNFKEGLSAVIWSCGENGKDETSTGASPDPAKFPKSYFYFGGGPTGDDITNL